MSFSGEVKEELVKHTGSARHCLLAELAAIMTACGYVSVAENGEMALFLQTENELVVRKCFTILKKAFISSLPSFVACCVDVIKNFSPVPSNDFALSIASFRVIKPSFFGVGNCTI